MAGGIEKSSKIVNYRYEFSLINVNLAQMYVFVSIYPKQIWNILKMICLEHCFIKTQFLYGIISQFFVFNCCFLIQHIFLKYDRYG